MCGIIACKGKTSLDKALKGLKKLEYRGYDSCGVAFKTNEKIEVIKSVGYIDKLIEKVGDGKEGYIAIGHTRWATHGGVTIENSHPHTSSSGRFVIVHNGILENYKTLKNEYLGGTKFSSETDSEVIAQLMDYFYKGDVWSAFKQVVSLLRGSYAIVLISSLDNNIYFARHSSPMVISRHKDGFDIASDILGLDNKTEICYVADNSVGYIDNNLHIYDKNYNEQTVAYVNKGEFVNSSELVGYAHYMHKEIHEIPKALKRSYEYLKSSKFLLPKEIKNILIVGCGTSYHSGLLGKKYIEEFSGLSVECVIASEFIYNNYLSKEQTLGIFISQSGETADTLTAMKKAKENGVYTLAITNVENSSITYLADSVMLMKAGAEICVASTKAYTTQVFYLILLSNMLINLAKGNYLDCAVNCVQNQNSEVSNADSFKEGRGASQRQVIVDFGRTYNYLNYSESQLEELFDYDILSFEEDAVQVAEVLSKCQEIHIIGKGYDYITAMESSLKIKEVSYIFTDAYPSGELKHGTLSLIDDNSYVLSLNTQEELLEKGNNAIHEIVARGGKVISISQFDNEKIHGVERVVSLSRVAQIFMPIVAIIPIDLIAYRVAVLRGANPDKPRNLAKSVTVE